MELIHFNYAKPLTRVTFYLQKDGISIGTETESYTLNTLLPKLDTKEITTATTEYLNSVLGSTHDLSSIKPGTKGIKCGKIKKLASYNVNRFMALLDQNDKQFHSTIRALTEVKRAEIESLENEECVKKTIDHVVTQVNEQHKAEEIKLKERIKYLNLRVESFNTDMASVKDAADENSMALDKIIRSKDDEISALNRENNELYDNSFKLRNSIQTLRKETSDTSKDTQIKILQDLYNGAKLKNESLSHQASRLESELELLLEIKTERSAEIELHQSAIKKLSEELDCAMKIVEDGKKALLFKTEINKGDFIEETSVEETIIELEFPELLKNKWFNMNIEYLTSTLSFEEINIINEVDEDTLSRVNIQKKRLALNTLAKLSSISGNKVFLGVIHRLASEIDGKESVKAKKGYFNCVRRIHNQFLETISLVYELDIEEIETASLDFKKAACALQSVLTKMYSHGRHTSRNLITFFKKRYAQDQEPDYYDYYM